MIKIKQMMRFRLATFVLIPSFVAGCASVRTFNMPKVEQKIAKAYQTSEEVNHQIEGDWTQKKTLVETLKKAKSSTFKEIENDLKLKLTQMENALKKTKEARKSMTEAKGEIAALGYANKKVSGDQPEYTRVEDAVAQFEAATQKFNEAAGNYTRESNSLADLVAVKKLYYNFDVAEFDSRAEKTATAARENLTLMEREITRTENLLNSYLSQNSGESETTDPIAQLLEQMKTHHAEQLSKIKDMDEMRQKMKALSQGGNKIPSTDPNWKDVQKIVLDYDRAALAVNEIYKTFQGRVEKLRSMRNPNP